MTRPPVELTKDEPYAEVEQDGRWTYLVSIQDGLMTYGPEGCGWLVWGRGRAQRKARRELARYNREQAWEASTWRIS